MKKILIILLAYSSQYCFSQDLAFDIEEENRIQIMQRNLDSASSQDSNNNLINQESSETGSVCTVYTKPPAPVGPPDAIHPEYRYSVHPQNPHNNLALVSPSGSGSSSSTNSSSQKKKVDLRLHQIASTGLNAGIEFLISEVKDLEIQDDEGNTPLHVACLHEYPKVCETLLKHGSSSITLNNKGWTSLHCAAVHNNVELIKLLVDKIGNIDITTTGGDTALHIASKKGNELVCAYLLSRNANPALLNSQGRSPFDNAFEHEDLAVAKVFSKKGSLSEIIQKTIQKNRPAILARLLNESKDLKKDLVFSSGTTALHVACALGIEDILQLSQGLVAGYKKIVPKSLDLKGGMDQRQILSHILEKSGMSVDTLDQFGRTPLHIATEWGQEIACMTLLDKQASVKKIVTHRRLRDKTFTPMTLAAIYNHEPILRLFLDNLILNYGEEEFIQVYPYLLSYSIDNSSFNVVKLLLQYKNKPQFAKKTFVNCYPLHRASTIGNLEICKLILNDGVNPEEVMNLSSVTDAIIADFCHIEEKNGLTPLHCAAHGGHFEICELLLRKRAAVNCRSNTGLTPLAFACQKNSTKIVKLFLSQEADITVEALEFANVALCQLLLEKANSRYKNIPNDERGVHEEEQSGWGLLHKKDSRGQTLLHKAAEQGNFEKCACLLDSFASLFDVDNEGRTALHLACNAGDDRQNLRNNGPLQTIKLILADEDTDTKLINLKDTNGNTALSNACKGGKNALVAVQMLLDAGADPELSSLQTSGRSFRLRAGEQIAPELENILAKARNKQT